MKLFNKVSITALTVLCILGLAGLVNAVTLPTTPSLGVATTYGILASTYTNTVPGTTINGDVGFTTGPAVVPGGTRTNYGSGAPYATAGIDQGAALNNLNGQACTFTFANGAIDLATDTTHGAIGMYTPGVYCTAGPGAASIGTAGITLSGSGTYIFRINGALTSVANSSVAVANGASACDVFWTPTEATTLGADSTFKGTNIDAAGITLGNNVSWIGRALAFGGTVTTDIDDTITAPTCAVPETPQEEVDVPVDVPVETPQEETVAPKLTIIKKVVNNNGGIAVASAFTLHVKLSGTDVQGSPRVGTVAPGTSYTLSADTYVVSEGVHTGYAATFSGDCDATGTVVLALDDEKTCTITNDDIAPIVSSTTPSLPQTGLPPVQKTTPWRIIIPVGIVLAVLALALARKHKMI